jgi:hypothetical protein
MLAQGGEQAVSHSSLDKNREALAYSMPVCCLTNERDLAPWVENGRSRQAGYGPGRVIAGMENFTVERPVSVA